jgi:hypothetical protein
MDSDDSDSDTNYPLGFVSAEEKDENRFNDNLPRVQRNDPDTTWLHVQGYYERIQNMTDEGWEEFGRHISNNSYLEELYLSEGALNDHRISFLFRGLTRSTSINCVDLSENGLSVEGISRGVRSMVPFLHNSISLLKMILNENNIRSEGFNLLLRALRGSSIRFLSCSNCGIESIEIDSEHIPRNVKSLVLYGNNINADGCRGLAKLLQGADSTLAFLQLNNNEIDDEGVAVLVDALQNNKSLVTLDLRKNDGISDQGQIMLLKLVNDVSSIEATLHSNHTLKYVRLKNIDGLVDANDEIQTHINMATQININYEGNTELAGREKMIQSQLHSETRAILASLQGIDHSVYREIDSLHLPEVLSLIGRRHLQGELFDALKTSIIRLFSTVDMKECIQQQRAYHAAKAAEHEALVAKHAAMVAEHAAMVAELDTKLVTIEESDGNVTQNIMETQSSKRRRV